MMQVILEACSRPFRSGGSFDELGLLVRLAVVNGDDLVEDGAVLSLQDRALFAVSFLQYVDVLLLLLRQLHERLLRPQQINRQRL